MIEAPGIVAVAWAMVRRVEEEAAKMAHLHAELSSVLAEIKAERAAIEKCRALRSRREVGIPDHEWAEDTTG